MTNGHKTIPHEKNQKPYHPKLHPETATLDQIIKLFGQESKIDPNLFTRYLKRVKELVTKIDEQNAFSFVQNLDSQFKENPTPCQLVIWYSMSKHLSLVFQKIETANHNNFFLIQYQLRNVPDRNFQTIFSKNIITE